MSDLPVVIVGAGLAGLSCAIHLRKAGNEVILLEASDRPGGRLRTETVDGFVLDRGFQVFQTAYPEAQQMLDYEALKLVELEPGAVVRRDGQWVRMSDPIRRPTQALATLFNSIGNLSDRWKLMRLKSRCLTQDILSGTQEDKSTLEFLREDCAFSEDMIASFFRPWLSGIFLESELASSAKYFQFVFRNLAAGPVSYPASGIQAIPDQLAEQVGRERIRCQQQVKVAHPDSVVLESGERIAASKVVLAVPNSERLLNKQSPPQSKAEDDDWAATACLYYVAEGRPTSEKSLMLNGGDGPINHAIVLSNSVPSVAPAGMSLMSVNLVDQQARAYAAHPDELESPIHDQLLNWFGDSAGEWKLLKSFCLPQALPKQPAGFYQHRKGYDLQDNIYHCGDGLETSSLHGALRSGRLVAEAIGALS